MNLADLIRGAGNDRDDDMDDNADDILIEARIQRLNEVVDLINSPNPYKRGDYVTPRRGGSAKGAGKIHIVSRILENQENRRERGLNGESDTINVEVVCFGQHGLITTFALAHYQLEPYTGPVS